MCLEQLFNPYRTIEVYSDDSETEEASPSRHAFQVFAKRMLSAQASIHRLCLSSMAWGLGLFIISSLFESDQAARSAKPH